LGERDITLDPDNWDALKTLGHRMLDDMLTHQQTIRSQPFSFPPKAAIQEICVPLTVEGDGEERVYDVFRRHILPYTMRHTSPLFWGLVVGTGSPYGMLAEMLRAGANSVSEDFTVEAYVHQQVINWIKQLLGYPDAAGGVIVSGGSEANFTCLAVARNARADVDVKARGVQGLSRPMTLYCGDETHHCLERSVELLGLGNTALRWIPTDDECKIRIDELRRTIQEDRRRNRHPFCVIGCAGTVNSGAVDDLHALADLCAEERLWFHVDGAFGAWLKLSKSHRHLVAGLERADSVAVDLHKWMYMPYGIGCALMRDRLAHYRTFVYGHEATYLTSTFAQNRDRLTNPHNLALPLSRCFNSLKAYMLLRAYGMRKYRQLIQQNLDHMRYLSELLAKDADMELMAPVTTNIVCFRYHPSGFPEDAVTQLNKLIYDALSRINFLMISDTTIKGTYMLRACNVNHRSRKQDFEVLAKEVKRAGATFRPLVKDRG
jgi:aromatic-L-amino-acid decarboxylase